MNKITKKELERRMVYAREEAATAWCKNKTKKKIMDVTLAEAFAEILVKHMYEVHLGCATTRELLSEIRARIELSNKNLDYKTFTA